MNDMPSEGIGDGRAASPSVDHALTGVGSWIERRSRNEPDWPAVVSGERVWTYRELAERIRRLANGLRELGVQRGDRVGWIGPNHAAFLETLFATAMLGGVLSPVNHRLDTSMIATQLEDVAPTVLVTHGPVPSERLPDSVRAVIAVAEPTEGAVDLEAVVADATDDPIEETVGLDEICMIPFTSGTTGPSKGIMLTHGNVTWNAVNMLTCADLRNDDVTLAIAPFFRTGGTGVNVLPVLFMGGTVVVPESLDPDEILRLVERHRATVGFANPDLLDALTGSSLWPSVDLSSVRFVITGGAPVPDRLIQTFLTRGVELLQGYGLSEAAPVALLLDPDTALRKVGAAGRPPLFVDVRIERADGTTAGPGETGELLVRGPNVMAGYWNRPDATRAAIDEHGWLRTGDAGRMDQDGDVWIVDRVRDAFVVGEQVIYPGDVERVIFEHPSVADAGVAGLEAADGGIAAHAFVVLKGSAMTTEADILEFCTGRLPAEAVPRTVTFVDRLPRNSVGKLKRHELRGLWADRSVELR
jgi:acyl-CoA synthetase (AMP-forming)/AMP-acid ligase II